MILLVLPVAVFKVFCVHDLKQETSCQVTGDLFVSNSLMGQGGNMERRDVGDSAGVNSKLSDMQNAIESLTHTVNSVATKQQVRIPTVWKSRKEPASALLYLPFSLPSCFKSNITISSFKI